MHLFHVKDACGAQGFLTQDTDTAHSFFEQATDAFAKAVKEVNCPTPLQTPLSCSSLS